MLVSALSIAASSVLFPPPGLFGGISSGEILVVLVVVLFIFGPKQLPDLARTIGEALRGARKAAEDLKEEIGFDELMRPDGRRRPQRPVPPVIPPPPARPGGPALPPASPATPSEGHAAPPASAPSEAPGKEERSASASEPSEAPGEERLSASASEPSEAPGKDPGSPAEAP